MLRLRQVLAVVQQQLTPLLPASQHHAFSTEVKKRVQTKEERKQKAVHIVLLQDIYGFGRKGEVKEANPGWVRHNLFARGAALYATPENVQKYSRSPEEQAVPEDKDLAMEKEMLRMLRILTHRIVNISRKAMDQPLAEAASEAGTAGAAALGEGAGSASGAEGGEPPPVVMKGSVTPYDIRQAVVRQTGVQLHESHLLMDRPINSFGTFKVPLNFRMLDNYQVELQLVVHCVKALKHGKASV